MDNEIMEYRKTELEARASKLRDEKRAAEEAVRKYAIENKALYLGKEGYEWLGKYGKWELNVPQKKLFDTFELCRNKIFCFIAGNRSGKSFSAVLMALTMMKGHFPWEPDGSKRWVWDRLGWKPPIIGRVVGQDWESHIKKAWLPTMHDLVPKSWDVEVRKNSLGVDANWTFKERGKTLGTLSVMSNMSDSDVFEGASLHFALFDEPPKRDNYIATARGLVDNNGISIFAMTLLKEAWVDKEILKRLDENGNPDASVFTMFAESADNVGTGISGEGLKEFAKSLTPDEMDARLKGIPAYKSGLVLQFDRQKHVIERFKIPLHYIVDIAIDPHPRESQHIIFLATDPNNMKYVCYEVVEHTDGLGIAQAIVNIVKKNDLRVGRIIIDPYAKSDSNSHFSVYETVQNELGRFGLRLETASKDKDSGVIMLNEMLQGRNKIPSLFFFRDCRVSISQSEGWMYDEHNKPQKVDDHAPECLYRLALLGTKWRPERPKREPERENNAARGVTGY